MTRTVRVKVEDEGSFITVSGFVYGNYWGGGEGAYAATIMESKTYEEAIEKANKALADGSLDSGMGFESLIGAALRVTTTTFIIFNKKRYSHNDTKLVFIGNLTPKQKHFLRNIF